MNKKKEGTIYLRAAGLYREKKYRQAERLLTAALTGNLTDPERNKAYGMLTHIYSIWIKEGFRQFKPIAIKTCTDHIEWYESALPSLQAAGDSGSGTEVPYRLSALLEGDGHIKEALAIVEKALALGINGNGKFARRAARLRKKCLVRQ